MNEEELKIAHSVAIGLANLTEVLLNAQEERARIDDAFLAGVEAGIEDGCGCEECACEEPIGDAIFDEDDMCKADSTESDVQNPYFGLDGIVGIIQGMIRQAIQETPNNAPHPAFFQTYFDPKESGCPVVGATFSRG